MHIDFREASATQLRIEALKKRRDFCFRSASNAITLSSTGRFLIGRFSGPQILSHPTSTTSKNLQSLFGGEKDGLLRGGLRYFDTGMKFVRVGVKVWRLRSQFLETGRNVRQISVVDR